MSPTQKPLRLLLSPQYRIHVTQREPTHKYVSLFPEQSSEIGRISFGIHADSPVHGIVRTVSCILLDIVHEVHVVCSAQDDHLFGCRSPFE